MANLVNYLINSSVSSNSLLLAKTSGGLVTIDGAIQVVDALFQNAFSNFLYGGNATINSTSLSYSELNTLELDQSTTSTLINPIEVPITSNSTSPVIARAPSNTVVSIAPTQPDSISNTPVGNEPPLAFKGQYPYVHTMQSESGHIREVDDTPGEERLFERHKSGTYQEISKDGRKVVKVVGDNFTVIVHDDHVHIEGSQDVYVKGNINITCLNDVTINAGGRLEINARDNILMRGKSITLESTTGDIGIYSAANANITSTNNTNIYATKSTSITSGVDNNIHATNNVNITSNKDTNLHAASKMNITSVDDAEIYSAKTTNVLAGKSINMAAVVEFIQSSGGPMTFMASYHDFLDVPSVPSNIPVAVLASDAVKAKKTGMVDPPNREGTVPSVIEEVVQGVDDDPDTARTNLKAALDSGRVSQEQYDAMTTAPDATGESDLSAAADIKAGGNTNGIEKLPDTSISGTLQLSQHYRLEDLTTRTVFPYAIASQVAGGTLMTKAQIAANMALLAQNVLEPIRAKWGPITVNSAFRGGKNIGGGQHGTGQAVDIAYGARSSDYRTMYEIAQWIKNHVLFDQLILEYGHSQIWTHVSFADKNSGCKYKSNGKRILTCANAPVGSYAPGIIMHAWSPK